MTEANPKLAKAVAATRGLTTNELHELRNHISVLIQLGPASADHAVAIADAPDELLAIAEFCRDIGLPPVKTTQMMHGAAYDQFRNKLGSVREYIARVGKKPQQRALLRLGIKLLHKDMSERKLAISYMSFLNEFHRLPGCINREFPGYARAGFMKMIIRKKGKK